MRNIQQSIDSVVLHRPYLQHITNDLYHIAERIREIDSGYFIVWNKIRKKFEIHNVDTKGTSTYELTVPYDELDARTIQFCKETLVANTDKLIKKMQIQEALREEERKKDIHRMNESITSELANDLKRAE